MERQDPLRTGAIFKVLPQSMKAPPKIVKFDTSKTSTPSSATKTVASSVQDPLREAFNQIYRATPTPKMFVGRAIGGFNSSNKSPYWPSNPVQQSTVDSPLATSHTRTVKESNHQPTSSVAVTDEPISCTPSISSNGKSVPAITAESESIPRNISTKISPNATKVARIQSSVTESTAVAQKIPSRSISASSSNSSRGGSRSRTGGSDSLLLLVGGITRPISSATSSSSSSNGSSTRETGQRSNSTERRASSSTGSSRGRRTDETQIASLVQPASARRNAEIAHSSGNQTENSKKPVGKQISVEPSTITVSSSTRNNLEIGVSSSSTSKSNVVPSVPKTKPATGGKRKRSAVDESDASETDMSPAEKTRTVPGKNTKRASLGTGRNKRQNGLTPDSEAGRSKGKDSIDTEEMEQDEEGEEQVLTVTRSGRKSLPKKVIPLAEDLIQGEKQQQKANRGKRATSVPSSSSARPRGTTSATSATAATVVRKSLGTSSTASATALVLKATSMRNTAWSTSEVMALYQAQGSTDISAPDFWEQVAEGVAAVGFHRTAEECQQQWFVAVEEAAARKRNKEEKMKNKPKEVETRTAERKEDSGEPPVPVKAKRTSKNALKKMAQESSKATRDDDIFDSEAMRSYWAEDSAMDVADFLPTEDDLFEDLQLFDPAVNSSNSVSGGSAGLGVKSSSSSRAGRLVGQKKNNEEEEDPLDTEIEFGTSHVHKLHYRPPSKLFSAKSTTTSGETSHTSGKQTKLSVTQINKQVNAAVQGARKATGGDDSSESGSDDLESDEEDDE